MNNPNKTPLKKRLCLYTMLGACCISFLSYGQIVNRSLLGSLGGYFSSSSLQVSYSVGEAVASSYSTPNNQLNQGFQQNGSPFITIGLQEPLAFLQTNIYPNPVKNSLNVEFLQGMQYTTTVRLFDGAGKELKVPFNPQAKGYSINLQNLPAGLYFLHIQAQGASQAYQIIKIN